MNSQENLYELPGTGSKRVRNLQAKRIERLEQSVDVSKKAIGYVRLATEEQAAIGHGIESQQRAIKAFAESQGYALLEVIADAGVSGASRPSDRDGFRRILELAEARAFSVLLVWNFDRLARNLVYSVITVNDLKEKYGVVLRNVTEPIDTASSIGEITFAVLAGLAAEERRVIIRRTLADKREKAGSAGGFSGAPAQLGYTRDREGGLTVVCAESAVVRRIFEMRRTGLSLVSIALKLNNDGVSTKRGGSGSGDRMGPPTPCAVRSGKEV